MSQNLYTLKFVTTISHGNSEIIYKLITIFIEQTPSAIDVLKKAYQINDFQLVRSVAHTLKPTFGYFEIFEGARYFEKIEILATIQQPSTELEMTIRKVENLTARVINKMLTDSMIQQILSLTGSLQEALYPPISRNYFKKNKKTVSYLRRPTD